MCFNKETSLTIFLFGLAASAALMYKGNTEGDNRQIVRGTIIFVLVFMQLIEFFIWIYLKNKSINTALSYGVLATFSFQIALVTIMINVLGTVNTCPNVDKDVCSNLNYALIALCMGVVLGNLLISIYFYRNNVNILTKVDSSSCRLNWGSLTGIHNISSLLAMFMLSIYVTAIIIGCYLIDDLGMLIVLMAALVVVMPISLWYFRGLTLAQMRPGMTGSIWCVGAAFLIIFISILDIDYKFPEQ